MEFARTYFRFHGGVRGIIHIFTVFRPRAHRRDTFRGEVKMLRLLREAGPARKRRNHRHIAARSFLIPPPHTHKYTPESMCDRAPYSEFCTLPPLKCTPIYGVVEPETYHIPSGRW